MKETIKTAAGIVLGTIGVCVVLGFFFFSEKVKIERSLVDGDSHCPVAGSKKVWGFYDVHPPSITRHTAVVIDATDRIPDSHRKRIGNWFEVDFTKSLLRFERVAIYEVRPHKNSASPALGEPYFDQCAPPTVANKWIENPRLVRRQFDQDFMTKKLTVIKSLASQEEARWSPIMEVTEPLFKDFDRILLVSDLMQNTPNCSLYQRKDKTRRQPGCLVSSDTPLSKKSLSVVFLRRKKITSLQDSSLFDFWRQYIERRRGTFLVDTKLPTID